MLLEIAVGDAYGAGMEYVEPEYTLEHNHLRSYVAHPRHTIAPGAYTDDTQLSIAIAEAIVDDAPWTREEIADRFVAVFKPRPAAGVRAAASTSSCWSCGTAPSCSSASTPAATRAAPRCAPSRSASTPRSTRSCPAARCRRRHPRHPRGPQRRLCRGPVRALLPAQARPARAPRPVPRRRRPRPGRVGRAVGGPGRREGLDERARRGDRDPVPRLDVRDPPRLRGLHRGRRHRRRDRDGRGVVRPGRRRRTCRRPWSTPWRTVPTAARTCGGSTSASPSGARALSRSTSHAAASPGSRLWSSSGTLDRTTRPAGSSTGAGPVFTTR